jgi:hypothetical protein
MDNIGTILFPTSGKIDARAVRNFKPNCNMLHCTILEITLQLGKYCIFLLFSL